MKGAPNQLPVVALAAVLASLVSCGPDGLVRETIRLSDAPGLAVESYSDCRDFLGHRVPHVYVLSRPAYSVRMTTFETGTAGLSLIPAGVDGRAVELRAELIMDAKRIGIPEEPFRYWVLSDWLPEEEIEFAVVGDSGEVLGKERLPFTTTLGVYSRVALPSHGT